eukprot:549993-Pleurochrysis_carterae.AAC.1
MDLDITHSDVDYRLTHVAFEAFEDALRHSGRSGEGVRAAFRRAPRPAVTYASPRAEKPKW